MLQPLEVALPEAEHGRPVHLGVPADPVAGPGVDVLAVLVGPDVGGVVAVFQEDGRRVPVLLLARQERPALDDSRMRLPEPAPAGGPACRLPQPVPMMMTSKCSAMGSESRAVEVDVGMPNRFKETSQVGRVIGAGTWKRGHAVRQIARMPKRPLLTGISPRLARRLRPEAFQEALTTITLPIGNQMVKPSFMFATGIENSYPTINHGRERVDEMEKCGHYEHWNTDFDKVQELGIQFLRYGPPLHRTFLGAEPLRLVFRRRNVRATEATPDHPDHRFMPFRSTGLDR